MSQYKEIAVGGTVYFWFAANLTTGAAGDGATPLYDVRLAGAAAGAIPTASGTPTLLTHANYTDGLHEIAIDTTGYAEGEYAVFCTLTISSVNPAGFVGSFVVRAAASTLRDLVTAILADTAEIGTAGAGLTNINLPNQTMDITGNITGTLSGSVGSVTGAVGSVTGAVGSVTGAVGSVTAGVTVTTNNDKTGYALSAAGVQAIWDALTSGMVTVGSIGKKLADWVVGTIDTYTGNTKQTGDVFPLASTEIADIKAKTDQLVFTVANQVDANALSGGSGLDAAGVRAAVGLALANLDTQLADLPTNAELATSQAAADDATLAAIAALNNLSAAAAADAVLDEAMAGHVSAGTLGKAVADILVDTAEIGVAGAGLTAADDAVISAIAALNNAPDLTTAVADLPTNAELATALGTADDAVLAQVALVKAKTDSLTFTQAGMVDANVQKINDVTITGDGSVTPFGV